ncbi:MAG: 6,7-dimethyl-8-ribityllumazine synthase [Sphingobacteriales bacterium]|nr:6,7-dimethyl-8-ribityllumazine synthase [Sphingobacteriales bacterium]
MASTQHNLSEHSLSPAEQALAPALKIAIAVAEWNPEVTMALLQGCRDTLLHYGVAEAHIFVEQVPGSYELPLACHWLFQRHQADAVVALGCVVTGETRHDEYINSAVSQSLMMLNLRHQIPFIFGLLTPQNQQQALDRAGGKHGNKGVEAAITAIKMAALHKKMFLDSGRKLGY